MFAQCLLTVSRIRTYSHSLCMCMQCHFSTQCTNVWPVVLSTCLPQGGGCLFTQCDMTTLLKSVLSVVDKLWHCWRRIMFDNHICIRWGMFISDMQSVAMLCVHVKYVHTCVHVLWSLYIRMYIILYVYIYGCTEFNIYDCAIYIILYLICMMHYICVLFCTTKQVT